MKAFCFSLAFLCLVQTILALPRPDFGINGDVGNSDKVDAGALSLNGEFVLTGQKDITLTAGYTLLATLRTKLIDIGDAIVLKGTAFATQLKTLSTDDTGPYTPAFGLVETKLNELETLFRTGLAADITAIVTPLGRNSIKLQFEDAFADVLTIIGTLRTSLTTLKTDVGKAQRAAGTSATVSTAIIRKNIPAKSVTDVVTNVRTLRANVQLVTFIINSSLENIALADEFVVEITADAKENVHLYDDSVLAFQTFLTVDEAATLTAEVDDNEPETVAELLTEIDADLTAAAGYSSSTLQAELTSFGDALVNGLSSAKTAFGTSLTTYSNKVPNYITDLNVDFGNALCLPIQTVSVALAANAPYSDFCFSKYSPRVVALLGLTISAFDMCFQREVDKFATLEMIVAGIVVQLAYNFEDLYGNLAECLLLDDPDLTSCFTTITPYYVVLTAQITEHTTTLEELVDAETVASSNRLGACIISSLYVTIAQGYEISTDVTTCMTSGPQAPASGL